MFQNTLLAEVRTFYPREYALGKYGLELLERELGIHFPDDEAANIALHLVNAEYENSIRDTLRITQTLHDVLTSLAGWPHLHLDQESGFYDEFTVHLKFLVFRAFPARSRPRRIRVLWKRCGSVTRKSFTVRSRLWKDCAAEVVPVFPRKSRPIWPPACTVPARKV